MKTLREIIKEAEEKKVAVGHFNVADFAMIKGIVSVAKKMNVPVILGVSEGEREFFGVRQIADIVKSIRESHGIDIFLNADHTHSFEKIKEAVEAGFDAVLFDAGQKSLEENIELTKKVVDFVKEFNAKNGTDILIEGELGYIGSGSVILDRIPEGVSIKEEDMTKADEARKFIEETGVDLIAPSVGNIHGMFDHVPNPNINIDRIKEIKNTTNVSIVIHGGSGIISSQFVDAINAGVSIIHISTEIRVAWKRGLDLALLSKPKEIAPYKIFPDAISEVEKVIEEKLRIFNKIQ